MIVADAAREPARVSAEATLSVLSRDPACTIAMLAGDLDIATTPALRERLFSVLGLAGGLLIIDLSGVSFCDAGVLAMLIGTQRRARQRGITIRLAAPSRRMAKLLRVTGLERSFTICATLDEALPARVDGPPVRSPATAGRRAAARRQAVACRCRRSVVVMCAGGIGHFRCALGAVDLPHDDTIGGQAAAGRAVPVRAHR